MGYKEFIEKIDTTLNKAADKISECISQYNDQVNNTINSTMQEASEQINKATEIGLSSGNDICNLDNPNKIEEKKDRDIEDILETKRIKVSLEKE